MAIKTYKPVTPGRRGMTVIDYSGLSKVAPERRREVFSKLSKSIPDATATDVSPSDIRAAETEESTEL